MICLVKCEKKDCKNCPSYLEYIQEQEENLCAIYGNGDEECSKQCPDYWCCTLSQLDEDDIRKMSL